MKIRPLRSGDRAMSVSAWRRECCGRFRRQQESLPRSAHATLARSIARKWLSQARSLAADSAGATVVEFAAIAPVLLTMMTGIVDMGYMFTVQHNMTSVSQEAARLVAVGELATGYHGETYVKDRLMLPRTSYVVDVDQVGGNVVVDVDAPFRKVVLVDILGIFRTGNLSAQSRMRIL